LTGVPRDAFPATNKPIRKQPNMFAGKSTKRAPPVDDVVPGSVVQIGNSLVAS
jgi:hypothetical protein